MARRDSKFFDTEQRDHTAQTMEAEAFAALERCDGQKALEIFKKMAALGSSVAHYCVGDIYLHGQGGIQHDPTEAKKWYEKAFSSSVERLSKYAAIKLGYIYGAGYDEANRYGAAVNYTKAFEYLKNLENSDIAVGLLNLGIMYEKGLGTPRDLKKARACYRRAAELGHIIAKKCWASIKVRDGEFISGYFLWGASLIEAFVVATFKRNSRRLVLL